MEDIIVDEPAPTSIRSRTQKRFRRSRPRRDLTVYLFDWLVKGMVVALLLSINFLLFASAGNFTVFSSGFSMSYETFFVLAAIFGVSLALMFLISFSSFLQNVVTAAAVGFFVYISLNQFALFDKFSFLAYMTAPYLGNETAMNFMTNSDIVASGAAAVLSFIFLAMSDKKNIAYFTGILIVVFAGILADEYFNRENHNEFKTVYDNSFSKAERGKKFIYIMLPNAASVSYLEDMKEANADAKKVENVQNIMLGFFAKNDFTLYPNAFVTADDPFKNMIRSFNNLSKDKEDSFIASTVSMDGYWSFKNINDEYIYLNENQLFDVFRKARYKISAYKSRGMDMCGKNGVRNADRCVEKVNSPISFDDMKLSALERTKLLVIQWLESMGVFNNMEPLYTALKAVTRPESKLKQLIKERGFAGFLRLMKELAQLLTEAVKDFLRHANVKELELRLTAAGEDAADTAVKYGYACSVVYPVVSMITALSGCKNYKVSVIPGFREKESSVFCYIKIRFGPIFLVASGFKALHKYFKLVLNQKKVETLKMEQTIAD